METKFSNRLFFVFTLALAIFSFSCRKDFVADNEPIGQLKSLSTDGQTCIPDTFKLFAGQTNWVGNLLVTNDGSNLSVTYLMSGSYTLSELHLWVGNDPTLVPLAGNGQPIPGQFPYNVTLSGATNYTFTIPLSQIFVGTTDFCSKSVYVFAHGVTGGETLWSFGTPFNSPRWGWYSTYSICCANPPNPTSYRYETAFAKFSKASGGYIFTTNAKSNPEGYPTLGLSNNRWGWAGYLTTPGTYTADVWAGAGLNKTSSGVKVGTVTVIASSGSVTVTYTMLSGFALRELHSYISTMSPTTLAPGQYGNTMYFDPNATSYSQTYSIANYAGETKFWIILHSVSGIPI